jgi:hypothetical protein
LNQQRKIEFTQLAPVLNVRELASERRFYESLGLPVIYEGPEYPDFIAFGTESVDFGIQQALTDNDPPGVLTWQIGVADIESRSRSVMTTTSTTSWTCKTTARLDVSPPAVDVAQWLPSRARRPDRKLVATIPAHGAR